MAPGAAKSTANITSALDTSAVPPFYKRKNGILLYFLLTSSLLSSLATGFDGSMTNAMQLLDRWQERFGHPTGSTLGFFGASTGIGGVIPLIFCPWLGDKWGRKAPTIIGAIFVIIGALIQAFAINLSMFIGGKIVLGFGVTTVQLGAPVLVTELSHPKERASVSTFYNTSIYLGYVIGAWITFGVTSIASEWQWKLPTLLQVVPSVYQLLLIGFCPESPRWLVATGKEDKALQVLTKYHGDGNPNSSLVAIEFAEIQTAIARDRELNMTWRDFFRSIPNWKRIFLCTCVACFSQTCGNLLVSNYLPQILVDTGLTSTFQNTLVNGMMTLWSYIVTLLVAFFINRFSRRTFFLTGSTGVLVVFVVWTICAQQYSDAGSLAAGRVVIACIFLFQTFYSIAWLNLVVLYPLEICPYSMRAKAWSYTLLVIYISQIFGNYVNPVGIEAIGWKFYIYYCVWAAVILAIVYFCFVETRGPTLEELALIFDKPGPEGKLSVHTEEHGDAASVEKKEPEVVHFE